MVVVLVLEKALLLAFYSQLVLALRKGKGKFEDLRPSSQPTVTKQVR
jgi:hypothetical protein